MGTPESRMIAIQTIFSWIKVAGDAATPAQKELLISHCGSTWGTARRTALEYLNELLNNNQIVIDGSDVWTSERWKKIQRAKYLDYSYKDKNPDLVLNPNPSDIHPDSQSKLPKEENNETNHIPGVFVADETLKRTTDN